MRVLVLGASGFIGAQIVAQLLTRNYEVLAGVRDPAQIIRRFPAVDAVQIDLMKTETHDPAFWTPLLEEVDAVINAAGVLQHRRDADSWAVHLLGPKALAEAAGSRRFVQISALGLEAETTYAKSKRAMEEALVAAGGEWTILRPSIVNGESARGAISAIRALSALPWATPAFADNDPVVDPVHVEDLAALAIRALEERRLDGWVIEIGGPERLTLTEMMERYRTWLGLRPAWKLRVPRAMVRAVAVVGDFLHLNSLSSTALAQLETRVSAAPSERLEEIGFRARPLSEVLASRPSGPQDLWRARLYFWRPALRVVLAVFWVLAGLVDGVLLNNNALYALHLTPYLGDAFSADIATMALSALYVVVGGLVLMGWRPKLIASVQLAILGLHAIAFLLIAPVFWLAPFGGLAKTPMVMMLVMLYRLLEQER